MVEETYKFKWKTFEEEMPESYEIILVRSPKKTNERRSVVFFN